MKIPESATIKRVAKSIPAFTVSIYLAGMASIDRYHPQPSDKASQPTRTKTDVILYKGQTAGKNGGVLLDYSVASGVDCGPGSQVNRQGAPVYSRAANITLPTELSNEAYADDQIQNEAMVGENSMPVGSLGGYYPLKSGWLLRYTENDGVYTLFNFESQPAGKEYIYDDLSIYVGELVGQKVASYREGDFQFGESYSWTDGATDLSIAMSPNFTSFTPDVSLSVECSSKLPTQVLPSNGQ